MSRGAPREWDALEYHRLGEPQLEWGRRVLRRLRLTGDEAVLDAGCGSGRLTAELAAMVPRGRVVAVDASSRMAELAQEHLAPMGDRVRVVVADLLELRLDEPVDAVFSAAVFHHITDHPRLFARLLACLRPGGALVAQCGGGPNLARLRELAARAARGVPERAALDGWPGPWEFADAATTAGRLRGAGFLSVATSVEPAFVPFDDPRRFRDHLRSITLRSHLARLPDASARERYLDDVVALSQADERPLTLDHWRLDLSGLRAQ